MSSIQLKKPQSGPRKHMHRLLQRSANEAFKPPLSSSMVRAGSTATSTSCTRVDALTSSSPLLFGTVSAPASTVKSSTTPLFGSISSTLSTHASTLTSSRPPLFCTISAPLSTASSRVTSSIPTLFSTMSAPLYTTSTTMTFTPTTTTPPQFGTVSTQSSTTSSTPATSSTPSTTSVPSTPVEDEQEDILIDGRLRIKVEANDLEPSGKCASIISKSFLDKVDPNGLTWGALSEDTIEFYWEEFQKKCHWDVAIGKAVKTAWTEKAKERYRQYIYKFRSITRNQTRRKPSHIDQEQKKKKNRCKGATDGKAPPTHNGGSASHKQIATDMEEYTGRAPSAFDVFVFTHTKDHDGKTFIDEKSKKVHFTHTKDHDGKTFIDEKSKKVHDFFCVSTWQSGTYRRGC